MFDKSGRVDNMMYTIKFSFKTKNFRNSKCNELSNNIAFIMPNRKHNRFGFVVLG